MKLVRAAIWLATGWFVLMLFYPLVTQMLARLSAGGGPMVP